MTNNFDIYEWRMKQLLKEAAFNAKKSDLNDDSELSDYEKKRGMAIAKNIDEIQLSKEFNFSNMKGDPNNPDKKVPNAIPFNFEQIKSIVGPENIKLVSKIVGKNTRGRGAGRDKKEFILYISKDLKTALDQMTRGRTSRETEKGKFDLTKKLDAIPTIVRGIIKKGTDGAKLSDFGTTPMYQVNWPILGQAMNNPNIYWLEVPKKKVEEQPAEMIHNAEYLEEDDWMQKDDESDMAHGQLANIKELVGELMGMIKNGDQLDAWVQAKLTKAEDYLDSVYHYLQGEEATEEDEVEYDNLKMSPNANVIVGAQFNERRGDTDYKRARDAKRFGTKGEKNTFGAGVAKGEKIEKQRLRK